MNILMISCGNADYDGRLRELVKVCRELGNVRCYSYGSRKLFDGHRIFGEDVGYLQFIRSVSKEAKTYDTDVVFVDNRKASIPALIVNKKKKAKLVQDCRELYEISKVKGISSKIGCIAERMCAKKADVLICANAFRGDHMVSDWGTKRPIVYENLRKLEYSDDCLDKAENMIDPLIKEGEFRIISTSGCSVDRTNDVLVKNINKINGNVRVFLVGKSEKNDVDEIGNIIKDRELEDKVVILGQLNQTELKYLINKSHLGVVNYNQKDLNNRYCASGKIYEFIYEGIPVITTTNPPLKEMCDKYGIGESDDAYFVGINRIIHNYDNYRTSVELFVKEHSINDNNRDLLINLKRELV